MDLLSNNCHSHKIQQMVLVLYFINSLLSVDSGRFLSNLCCFSLPDIMVILPFSLATLIVVVCSIKMFRSAYADTPKQYLVLTFTVLFFKYDYAQASETFLINYFFMSILFSKVSSQFLPITCPFPNIMLF